MTEELKKVLGFWSCLAVAVGLVVVSTTLVLLGHSGDGHWRWRIPLRHGCCLAVAAN